MKKTLLVISLLAITFLSAKAEKPKVKIGGAVRMDYKLTDQGENQDKGGEFNYDVMMFNVDASYKGIIASANYRFYSEANGGGMLKYGWLGFKPNEKSIVKCGLVPVNFGTGPVISNNFWYTLNYVVGLEDQHDMGISYDYDHGNYNLFAAFYKNSDLQIGGELNTTRFAADIMGQNKEINKFALRGEYVLGDEVQSRFGLSAIYGGIYNIETEKTGYKGIYGAHYVVDVDNFELKTQYAYSKSSGDNLENLNNPNAVLYNKDVFEYGCFGSSYDVVKEYSLYDACLSYNIPTGKKAFFNKALIYNDFSMLDKTNSNYTDCYSNIVGTYLVHGNFETFIDFIFTKNGDYGASNVSNTSDNDWHMIFNVNVGYYF